MHRGLSALGVLAAAAFAVAAPALRAQPASGTLRLVSDLTIDGDQEEFTYAGFALSLSQGRIVFADLARYQMRMYSSSGALMTTFGRQGAGPGEFTRGGRAATLSGGVMADSVWIFDPIARRISIFTPAGRISRTITLDKLSTGVAASFHPLALYSNGSALGLHREVRRERGLNAEREFLVMKRLNGSETSRYALDSKSATVAVRDPRTGQSHSWPVAASSRLLYCVSQDGQHVGIVREELRGDSASVEMMRLSSSFAVVARRSLKFDVAPRPRGEAARYAGALRADLLKAGYSSEYASLVIRAVERATPTMASPLHTVRCGRDGSMWLAVRSTAKVGMWEWIALDSSMRTLGRTAPDQLHLLQPSAASVLALRADADGVPSVLRMSVRR